jgi:hypothetical protein
VPVKRILECDRCSITMEYTTTSAETWAQLYLVSPRYSPSYKEDIPLLCPKCQKDLDKFMKKEKENGKEK